MHFSLYGGVRFYLSFLLLLSWEWINVQANLSNSLNGDSNRGLERLLSRDWVRIYAAPPRLLSVRIGETVELECEAIGSPPPRIRWTGPNGNLNDDVLPILENTVDEEVSIGGIWRVRSRLVINCPNVANQGLYTCHAWAASTKESSPGSMLVVNPSGHRSLDICEDSSFLPPRVVLWAPVVLELMGRNISLPCNAIGHPSPVVRWLDDDGRPIGSALSHASGRYRQLPNGNLLISSLRWADMGGYTCVAESFTSGHRDGTSTDMISTFVYPVLPE